MGSLFCGKLSAMVDSTFSVNVEFAWEMQRLECVTGGDHGPGRIAVWLGFGMLATRVDSNLVSCNSCN